MWSGYFSTPHCARFCHCVYTVFETPLPQFCHCVHTAFHTPLPHFFTVFHTPLPPVLSLCSTLHCPRCFSLCSTLHCPRFCLCVPHSTAPGFVTLFHTPLPPFLSPCCVFPSVHLNMVIGDDTCEAIVEWVWPGRWVANWKLGENVIIAKKM